jgi:hypothetical protein
MVEAGSHLKLLPASTLDICKVFEKIDMLPIVSDLPSLTGNRNPFPLAPKGFPAKKCLP